MARMREAASSPAHLASSCHTSLPSPPGENSPVHQFAAHLGGELLPPRFAAFLPSIRPRPTAWGFFFLGIRGDYNATSSAARKVVRRVFGYDAPAYAALHGSRQQLTRPPKTCWHRLPRTAKGPRVTARPPSGSIRLGFPTERTPTWHAGAVDLSPTCTEPSSTERDCRRNGFGEVLPCQRISRDSVTLRPIVSGVVYFCQSRGRGVESRRARH